MHRDVLPLSKDGVVRCKVPLAQDLMLRKRGVGCALKGFQAGEVARVERSDRDVAGHGGVEAERREGEIGVDGGSSSSSRRRRSIACAGRGGGERHEVRSLRDHGYHRRRRLCPDTQTSTAMRAFGVAIGSVKESADRAVGTSDRMLVVL